MLRFERLPEPLDPSKEYLVLTQEEYSSKFHLVILSGDQQRFLGEFSISHFQYKHDILTALRVAVTDLLEQNQPSDKFEKLFVVCHLFCGPPQSFVV